MTDQINKEESTLVSDDALCTSHARLSSMQYGIFLCLHCFALFDDPVIEEIGISVLEDMSGSDCFYFPLTRKFRNEWFHHAFNSEVNKLSSNKIAKKFGVGVRYVCRTISGRWK